MSYSHPATIGMRASDMETWLRPGPADSATMALRRRFIAEKPADVLALLPAASPTVLELANILAARDGWTAPSDAFEALEHIGGKYIEDICLLTKFEADGHIVGAAVVCFPNRWKLAEKAGKPILAVHDPVPDYADKLSAQVDFFLDRLRPGRCFRRANWGLVSVDTLHLPDPVPPVNPTTDTNFFLRHEGQSFVKLPETGAVVFTIDTVLTPWRDVLPEDRASILEQVAHLSPAWLSYKSLS